MENEGMPYMPGNIRFRHFVQFVYIIMLSLISGAVFQFISFGLCNLFYHLNINQIYDVFNSVHPDPAYKGAVYIVIILSSIGGFFIPALVIPLVFRQSGKEYLQVNNWSKPHLYVLGLLLVICIQPFITFIYELNTRLITEGPFSSMKDEILPSEEKRDAISDMLLSSDSSLLLVFNLLVIAILPAVVEEFFFRGALQKHLYNWSNNIHIAVWVGAVIFSAFHQQFLGFIPRILLGAVLGYLVYYSGTIWVPVVAHAANNALTVVGEYMIQKGTAPDILKEDYQLPVYSAWLSLGLAVLLYLLIRRFRTRLPDTAADE